MGTTDSAGEGDAMLLADGAGPGEKLWAWGLGFMVVRLHLIHMMSHHNCGLDVMVLCMLWENMLILMPDILRIHPIQHQNYRGRYRETLANSSTMSKSLCHLFSHHFHW